MSPTVMLPLEGGVQRAGWGLFASFIVVASGASGGLAKLDAVRHTATPFYFCLFFTRTVSRPTRGDRVYIPFFSAFF